MGSVYGDRPDPVSAATAFVAEHFADARAAFLGDGVLGPLRTPTSDLDVVVVLDPATTTELRPGDYVVATVRRPGQFREIARRGA